MNKRMKWWFDTWCKCVRDEYSQSLYDFYSKPSSRKVGIYERICHKQCNVRILSASCHFFTVGCMTEQVGDGLYNFVVETAYNTYTEQVSISTLRSKGLDVMLVQDKPVVVPLNRG